MVNKQHATKQQWVNEEIKEEIKKKYPETNENENTTFQNKNRNRFIDPEKKLVVATEDEAGGMSEIGEGN